MEVREDETTEVWDTVEVADPEVESDEEPIQDELDTQTEPAEAQTSRASAPESELRVVSGQDMARSEKDRTHDSYGRRLKQGPRTDWEETCSSCNNPDRRGSTARVLMCDFCPRVWHLRCLGLKRTPEGTWECPSCKIERVNSAIHVLDAWESEIEEVRKEEQQSRVWRFADIAQRRTEWGKRRGGETEDGPVGNPGITVVITARAKQRCPCVHCTTSRTGLGAGV